MKRWLLSRGAVCSFLAIVLLATGGCLEWLTPSPPDPGNGQEPQPGAISFFDDFQDGVSAGFGLSSGTWEVIGGELHPLTKEASAHVVDGENWTDYEVSADFRYDDLENLSHSSERGLVVRAVGQRKVVFWGSDERMWFEEYHPDHCQYGARMGNSVTQPLPLVCNVRVHVAGNRFQAYVNGVLILEVEDINNRYPAGTAGIEVDAYWLDDAERSFFDNFRVTALD